MATRSEAKLRKKIATAKKRDVRAAEWRARLNSKKAILSTEQLFWVESGHALTSRAVSFSRHLNAIPPTKASDRGRWVARSYLREGDVLLDRDCRQLEVVSLPPNPAEAPRVRRFIPDRDAATLPPPVFVYWVVEGNDLWSRPDVQQQTVTPPGPATGRWVSGRDLCLNDIVIGADGEHHLSSN